MTCSALASIVIPCYKGEAYLSEAIESCLRQTYANWELILVDDASPDGCNAIAERFVSQDSRIRLVVHEKNRGVSEAFNSGFSAARGEFMTRLAQDDVWLPEAIREMVAALESAPDAGLVYADEILMDANGNITGTKVKDPPPTVFASKNGPGMCFMWRRKVWERLGGFRQEFDAAEDYDFLARAMEEFPVVQVCIPLLKVRFHAEMGGHLYRAKQELAVQKVKSRMVRGWWRRRRHLARAFFDAGYAHGRERRWALSLKCMAESAMYWPLQLRAYRGASGVVAHWVSSSFRRT